MQPPVDDDAAAETAVEQEQGEARELSAAAVAELGERGEVHVVLHPHGAAESRRERRAERPAVRPLVVADPAVGRHDPRHPADRPVQRTVDRREAGVDQLGDVLDAVALEREGGVVLDAHRARRIDERYVCGDRVDVHGGGEAEGRMQCDAARRRSPRLSVDAGRGDGIRALQHPEHLGHRGARESRLGHELRPGERSAAGERFEDGAPVEGAQQGLRTGERSCHEDPPGVDVRPSIDTSRPTGRAVIPVLSSHASGGCSRRSRTARDPCRSPSA